MAKEWYELVSYYYYEPFTEDDYEMSYEEECESMARHVQSCTKAERDEYCKICLEY